MGTCVNKASFTGIFHDWGVVPGVAWTNRAIAENAETGFKPNAVVYMDVLPPANPKKSISNNIVEVPRRSLKQIICVNVYQALFAKTFFLYRYVSKYLSAFTFVSGCSIMGFLRLGPCYDFDIRSTIPLYKQTKQINLRRLCYMTYPYFN